MSRGKSKSKSKKQRQNGRGNFSYPTGLLYENARGKAKQLIIPSTQEGWKIDHRGTQTLVLPESKARWSDENRFFRSVILDRDGRVVSMGLPKFFSADKMQVDEEDMLAAHQAGEKVLITEKIDGSLLIRSVYNDRVLWRTRGYWDLGGLAPRIEAYLKNADPKLLDPHFMPEHSLHFEWCDSTTRVVINHPKPKLYLLNGINNRTLEMISRKQVEKIAEEIKEEATGIVEGPENLDELYPWLEENFVGKEGVVITWPGGLLRYKTKWYKTEHAKRFELNPTTIMRSIDKKRNKSAQDVIEDLNVKNPELKSWVEKVYQDFKETDKAAREEFRQLRGRARSAMHIGDRKKRQAFRDLDNSAYISLEKLISGKPGGEDMLIKNRRTELIKRLNGHL